MKSFPSLIRGVILLVAACMSLACRMPRALADGALPLTQTAPTVDPAEKALAFLQLVRVQDVCKIPLDLTVANATVEDVAARVQKKLASLPTNGTAAPRIEVKGVNLVSLSFAAKDSTVGGILRSSAMLAGAQLWVFSDHLLLAPQAALSPDELAKASANSGTALGSQNSAFNERPSNAVQQAFSSFIAAEVRGATTKMVPTSTVSGTQTPGLQVTFSDLSPESQAMLQHLIEGYNNFLAGMNDSNAGMPRFNFPRLEPSSDSLVGFNADKEGAVSIVVPDTGRMTWTLSGNGMGFSSSSPKPPGKTTRPPFVDPSAGKS